MDLRIAVTEHIYSDQFFRYTYSRASTATQREVRISGLISKPTLLYPYLYYYT